MRNDKSVTAKAARIMRMQYPAALAVLNGRDGYSKISGYISFYPADNKTLVVISVCGLDDNNNRFLGLHIHENGVCTEEDLFESAGSHYDMDEDSHPYHTGDMPPIFVNRNGCAWSSFITDRFQISDIIDRSVIIHSESDDFRSDPSGNSGMRIACGVIKKF